MATRAEMSKMYQRPTPEARHALRKLMAELSAPGLLGKVYQEDFIAASWMWMATLDPEEVAAGVAPFIRRFEAFFEGDETPSPLIGQPADPRTGEPLGVKKSRRGKSA